MTVDIFNTGKKYGIIYADPPWKYGGGKGKQFEGLAVNHYNTMSERQIAALPVGKLTDNGVLFMWATFPHLEEAFRVMRDWGFKYRTVAFVWVKTYKKYGAPYWTRILDEIKCRDLFDRNERERLPETR